MYKKKTKNHWKKQDNQVINVQHLITFHALSGFSNVDSLITTCKFKVSAVKENRGKF